MATDGGGKVAITKEVIKDFILKCFAKSSTTTRVSSVENMVHIITKILFSHLGSKGFGGTLFSVSFLGEFSFHFYLFFP